METLTTKMHSSKTNNQNQSEICEFLRDQTIFLTGATGFLGKIMLEKLLRVCEPKKIYILVRKKKGKSSAERRNAIFQAVCFDRLKSEKANFEEKIHLVDGDCGKENLGMSFQDEEILKQETTLVIHAAAAVKFDQSLRSAAHVNVRATMCMLRLAAEMPQLQVFVHVSTAYSFCTQKRIAEKLYETPISAENLLNIVDCVSDDVLDSMTPHLLGKWPNTYVYSKAIAEDCVRQNGQNLKIAVVRPGIVTSSMEEPMPGWIDNFYGVVGIVAGASLGVLRSLNADPDCVAQLVPVDHVVNMILASTWQTYHSKKNVIVYNQTGWDKNPVTWRIFVKHIEECAWDYATEKVLWYYCFALRKNKYWHAICAFFLHTVQAYVVDFILFCMGKPTLAIKNYARIDKLLKHLTYFTLKEWQFDTENVQNLWEKMASVDKKLFRFYMDKADWRKYARDSVRGGRVYLLKDPVETIPKGRRKLQLLAVAHYTFIFVWWFLVYKLARFIFGLFF